MSKFPEPPTATELAKVNPDICVLPSGSVLARIFFRASAFPASWNEFRYWGPAESRFDHHLTDALGCPTVGKRGIYYAASKGTLSGLGVCLAEVFQSSRTIDTSGNEPWFVIFPTIRDLKLLDLRGSFSTRMGASAAINTGPKKRAQRWSKALYDAFPDADGIIYPSSMGGGSDAFALYERSTNALPTNPDFHRPLNDPSLYSEIVKSAKEIGYLIA
jgi:hypothetical protein